VDPRSSGGFLLQRRSPMVAGVRWRRRHPTSIGKVQRWEMLYIWIYLNSLDLEMSGTACDWV